MEQHPIKKLKYQRLTLCHEEVEHGDDHRVPAEHVVPARLDPGQRHAKAAPDGYRPLDLSQGVAVGLQEESKTAVSWLQRLEGG